MQVSIGDVNIDDFIGYLTKIKESKYRPWSIGSDIWFSNEAWGDPTCKEAFRRLSTCKQSCGCTGYRPKEDCPDLECYCNK